MYLNLRRKYCIMCIKSLLSACTITFFTFTWLSRIFFVKLENVFNLSLLHFLEDLLNDFLVCFFSTLLSDFSIFAMSGGGTSSSLCTIPD